MSMKKVCVLGLGYIGLPTSSMLATNGFEVIGVDVNQNVVNVINRGEIHIEEPGLNTVVKAAVNSGNLVAKTAPEAADVFVIAVPTPINKDKTADMSYVLSATEAILPYLKPGNLVVLESTSPPRTTVDLLLPILERSGLKIGEELFVAHCPERVLPGNILHELVYNNRIVGGINEASALKGKQLYEKVVQGAIILTDATSAEMAKLMENTFRDVNIALANELSKVAYDLNLDALEVIKLANMHPRVNLHQPGPGVGGHCLAVDPWFIVEKSAFAKIIKLSRETNDSMPDFVVERIKALTSHLNDPRITALGVSYKGNVDDCRESPSTEVIEKLVNLGMEVRVYDPHVHQFEFELHTLESAFKDSDLVVLLTDHNEYKYLAPSEIGKLMRSKLLFDTRNTLNHAAWQEAGFSTEVLGKYGEK